MCLISNVTPDTVTSVTSRLSSRTRGGVGGGRCVGMVHQWHLVADGFKPATIWTKVRFLNHQATVMQFLVTLITLAQIVKNSKVTYPEEKTRTMSCWDGRHCYCTYVLLPHSFDHSHVHGNQPCLLFLLPYHYSVAAALKHEKTNRHDRDAWVDRRMTAPLFYGRWQLARKRSEAGVWTLGWLSAHDRLQPNKRTQTRSPLFRNVSLKSPVENLQLVASQLWQFKHIPTTRSVISCLIKRLLWSLAERERLMYE